MAQVVVGRVYLVVQLSVAPLALVVSAASSRIAGGRDALPLQVAFSAFPLPLSAVLKPAVALSTSINVTAQYNINQSY